MPFFQSKGPLVFPVSPTGTKRIRYPTGCDSSMVNGVGAAATQHFTGYMSLNPYYIPANVSSIDIICQTLSTGGGSTGTIYMGIYDANQGLENAFLSESTSFVSTNSSTAPYTNSLSLTKNYPEGWYIVAAVKTAGASAHTNGFVKQAHILGKPVTAYPGIGVTTDMFYLSSVQTYITNQTSGLLQTMSSALSTGTYTAITPSTTGSTPLAFLAY